MTRFVLLHLGVTPNYRGYQCVLEAVELARKDLANLEQITKRLYPAVAQSCGTTSRCVERNIRSVISRCWVKNRSYLEKLAGYHLIEKPTNGEFLGIITLYILRHEQKSSPEQAIK